MEAKQVPHSNEAEQAVIASILIDYEKMTEISEILQPHFFYNNANREIYDCFVEMNHKNKIIDLLSTHEFIKSRGSLDKVGGIEYLQAMSDAIPSSENAVEYANIVFDKFLARETLKRGSNILNESYEATDAMELIEYAEKEIFELSKLTRSADFVDWHDLINETSEKVRKLAMGNGKKITGLHTGFSNLDNITAGLQKSDLIILAARPSVGKTAFSLNLARNIAASSENNNAHVAFFSLEMGADQLLMRLVAAESRVPISNIKTGQLSEEEQMMFNQGMASLSEMNFHIDDTAGIKIGDIKSKCRKVKLEKGLDMVLIDYLQLITTSKKTDNRQQEVSEISRELKGLAKELQIPVVALSQLSRGVEQRADKKPMMSDIRESGAIEQDADIIMMIYRPEYYGDNIEGVDEETMYDGKTIVSLVKHRNGSTGDIEFEFQKEINRFRARELSDF
ncbi:replicative DNA helicase [Mollicutes bacterium LVI A0039]|nr:replicative DNA helicase [Mollicutes bacterium LVI A0039]